MSQTTFAQSEKAFAASSFMNDLRYDGRANNQIRNYYSRSNNLQHLPGSSYLSIKHENIQIYTGIKLKLQKHQDPLPVEFFSKVVLELSSMTQLNDQQQKTRRYMEQLLNKYIITRYSKEFTQLLRAKIPNSRYHTLELYIDCYLLTIPHICHLEYLYINVKDALKSTFIPNMEVIFNEVTNEQTIQLMNSTSQLLEKSSSILQNSLRLIGKYGAMYVRDMSLIQYQAVQSALLILYNGYETGVGIQSIKGKFKVQEIHQIVKFGKKQN